MPNDQRYTQRTTRRTFYSSPPNRSQRNHPVLGYWVPLVVTATLGLGALAAWAWSERTENDEDDYPGPKPQRPPTGQGASYPTQGSQPYPGHGPPPQGPPAQSYPGPDGPPPSAAAHTQPMPPPVGGEQHESFAAGGAAAAYYGEQSRGEESGWYAPIRGVMKRTPSPQQFFDSASKQVTAGMAAAGSALGSILEGEEDRNPYNDPRAYEEERHSRRSRSRGEGKSASAKAEKEGFSDHERWSEEAEELVRVGSTTAAAEAVQMESERRAESAGRAKGRGGSTGRPRKTVAVVVSADLGNLDDVSGDDATFTTEHASILSHLPMAHDPSQADLFVLIYAPHLTSLPPLHYQPAGTAVAASTIGSSYSEINTPAVTPGSELQSISPRIAASDGNSGIDRAFDSLYQQALSLVSHPSQILSFTTPTGYLPILRHLAPQMVYLTDSSSLSGRDGENVSQLKGWVGHTILVVGDEGHGGLADTETEDEAGFPEGLERGKWYERSSMIGFGKEVEVVDASRVGDDWAKRVAGKE